MVRHGQMQNPQQDVDAWLRSLVDAFEQTSLVDTGVAPCEPAPSDALLHDVIAQLSQPADAHPQDLPLQPKLAVHSPAICNRGWLPRSSPRSLAS